jgi:DNA replication protein DnaC
MSVPTCAQRLQAGLKDLRLPSMRGCFQETAERARAEVLSYEEYLLELTTREQEVRRQHRVERALRESGLPLEKTLAGLDRRRLPRTVDAHVNALLEGTFLNRCENVLAFGSPGTGKSHLLCAIGQELVYADRRVLFRRCDVLVQELLLAKRELTLPRLLKRWSHYDALVIDGPFAETKELIAGYTVVEAESLEAVLEWAKRWPMDCGGETNVELEIRRVFELEELGDAFAQPTFRDHANTVFGRR